MVVDVYRRSGFVECRPMSVSLRPGLRSTNRAIYGPRVSEPTIETEIDRLYGLPLAEFTKERDALARRLRADNRRDDAATVAELRKPVLAAWVVNQLAREQRTDIKVLVDAAAAIRAGKPGADDRFRAAAEDLVRAGRELLAASGRPATDAVVRDVATTLRAAAAAEPPELLLGGRLTEPLEATGFEAMAGAAPRRSARARLEPKPPARPDRARSSRRARRWLLPATRRRHSGAPRTSPSGRRAASAPTRTRPTGASPRPRLPSPSCSSVRGRARTRARRRRNHERRCRECGSLLYWTLRRKDPCALWVTDRRAVAQAGSRSRHPARRSRRARHCPRGRRPTPCRPWGCSSRRSRIRAWPQATVGAVGRAVCDMFGSICRSATAALSSLVSGDVSSGSSLGSRPSFLGRAMVGIARASA